MTNFYWEDLRKKSIVFRGPVLTQSGYGVHCRQVAQWLLKQDVDVKFITTPWGDTPWIINRDYYDGLAGEIMNRTVHPQTARNCDVSFQLQLPNEWDPQLSRVNIGMTAAVETDKCNPQWVSACNSMNAIIVPSEHAKKSMTSTGVITKPVYVIPESYSASCAKSELPQLEDFPTSFNFLLFGQITSIIPDADRKNLFYTIKWLCEAFANDKDVGIVLKTNAGRNSKIDRTSVTHIMKQLLSEVRVGQYPKFYLLHGDMSEDEVASLYRHKQIKSLVSLTRGEGYGLPILEAAASGLPVMATGWSGHLDFMNLGKFISIDYQLKEVHDSNIDNRIFMPGARWASPSEQDFKKRVRKFKDSPDLPRQWAKELQEKLLVSHNHESVSRMYDVVLKEVL